MQYYIHYTPGRLRIQTPAIHEKPAGARSFEAFVKGFDGITSIETRVVTGSATILFEEKKINCEQIIGILEKHGYFCLSKAETSDEFIEKTTKKVLEVAEQIIVDSAGGGIGGE